MAGSPWGWQPLGLSRGVPSSQGITKIHTDMAPLTQGSAGIWQPVEGKSACVSSASHLHIVQTSVLSHMHLSHLCMHMCSTSPGIDLPVQCDLGRARVWVRVGKLRHGGRRHQQPHGDTGTQFPVPRTTMAFAQSISGCPEAPMMGMIQSRAMWGTGGDGRPGIRATFCPQLGPEMSLRNPPAC